MQIARFFHPFLVVFSPLFELFSGPNVPSGIRTSATRTQPRAPNHYTMRASGNPPRPRSQQGWLESRNWCDHPKTKHKPARNENPHIKKAMTAHGVEPRLPRARPSHLTTAPSGSPTVKRRANPRAQNKNKNTHKIEVLTRGVEPRLTKSNPGPLTTAPQRRQNIKRRTDSGHPNSYVKVSLGWVCVCATRK